MGNCKIFRNNDGTINKVFDELGNESQLYYDTLFHVSTLVDKLPITPPIKSYLETGKIKDTSIPEVALGLWAYSYSDNFRNKYDIKVSKLEEVSIDDIIRHIEEYYPKPLKPEIQDLFESNPGLSNFLYKVLKVDAFGLDDEKIIDIDNYKLLDDELNNIINNPVETDSIFEKYTTISKIIKNKLKDYPIKVYYTNVSNTKPGYITLGSYSEYYKRIIINNEQSDDSKIQTLLHEGIHALTTKTLINSKNGDNKFYNLITDYRLQVTEYLKNNPDNLSKLFTINYALSNNDEFIAGCFTDPLFRNLLQQIPSTKNSIETLWNEFIDLIKDLLFPSNAETGDTSLFIDIINDTLNNIEDFEKKSIPKDIPLSEKNKIKEIYYEYLDTTNDPNILGFRQFFNNYQIPQKTFTPETKSKTELLEEFNHLVKISEMQGIKYPDDAIIKIKSFLQDLNFNLSTVDEILAKRGLKDNPKAVIDFAYNTIAFGDGATVEDFAEEIGHLIALHAPQDKNLDRALEAIKGTQLYKDNYLNYVKTYSKPELALEMSPERKAALEVLGKFYGKVLTGTLTEKDLKISKQSFFTRIINAVRRMINRTDNFNLRTYLERNRDNFFLEPGKEIKSKEIFYSLEESENITYNKMFSAIQRMTDTLKSKISREIKDTSAPLGEYSKRIANLKTQLGLVYQMKENIAYDSAVADFLKSLYVDSTNIFSFLEKFFIVTKEQKAIQLKDVKFNTQDKIFIGNTIIENNQTAVIFDDIKILKLKDDADLSTLHYSQLSELREFLTHYNSFINELGIDNLDNKLESIDKLQDLNALFKYAKDSLNSIESAVNLLNRKKMPDAIDELIEETGADVPDDIVAALKDTTIKGDLSMMEYLMGTTRDASQPILRLFNATVKNIMHIAKRNTLSFAGKFLDKLNHRIGQSMDWAYEKYNDKFTGYLISEYNYGWFKEEKEKFFKDINIKYKYPQDAYSRTKEINNIVTRHNNIFITENEISELSMKVFNEGSTPELIEKIENLNKKIEQIEKDYNTVLEYRNEISEWYKNNTTSIDNVDEIIQSIINDPELTSTEKNVWYTNNVLLNDDGDVLAYINELSQPSDKYLNPDYKKLSKTDLDDLNYIKKTKEELDKFLPTKINRLAPQTYQSTIDTFMKTQLPELKEKLKFLGKSTVVKQEDDEIGELTGDRINYEDETRIIKYNPTRYTRLLKEPNNISTDLLSSMIAYAKMVSEFKEKAERIEQIEFISQNIKSGYTVNTDTNVSSTTNTSNLIKQLENYLRVQIMGMSYPDITIPVINVNLTKLLKNFARFTSSKNLGLNFVTQAVDGITSTIWYNVEKVMGDTITKKSSKLGYKVFKELVQDSIKESASTIKNNKLSAILRTLGLSDNLHSIFNDLDKNILMRDVGNKALYAGYRASNFFVSGNAALSGMHNFRLYNGKWYTEREFSKIQNPTQQFDSLPSAYDNMRVENGLMIIDDMDTKTLNLFTRRMNNLISKIDGKLNAEDKTYAHSTLIGIITLIHRDWILDGISRRLKKRGFNFDTNTVDEGYWRTTGRFMSNFFASKEKVKNLKFLVENYNALDDVEKEGVRRTMYEMMVAIGFIALAIILNLGDDDDDDRPLDYLRDMAAYLATRTTVELTAFYNPFEYIYAATDVFVIGRDLKRIISFTEMFDAREIESGKWEGWTRSQKYFLQNIPGVNGTLSVANPEASNRFIINNVLGFAGGLDKIKYYSVPLIGSIDDQELLEIERDKR
jgi:chloramphenicol O-acetyltransferase